MAQERALLIRLSIQSFGSIQESYIQKKSVEDEMRLMKEILSYVNFHADTDPDEPVSNTQIN
ncbi:hypothetical protein NS365_07435 [Aureimonas ureilytica]|uniref:Uncharacterized protein n=2 Tax=Aureimonas ureilytica TaxID=401562 RepID=A0A175RSR4_9HYPH|nr:hypothetical protein NS365_07435 [Aureimonas ureilytica]